MQNILLASWTKRSYMCSSKISMFQWIMNWLIGGKVAHGSHIPFPESPDSESMRVLMSWQQKGPKEIHVSKNSAEPWWFSGGSPLTILEYHRNIYVPHSQFTFKSSPLSLPYKIKQFRTSQFQAPTPLPCHWSDMSPMVQCLSPCIQNEVIYTSGVPVQAKVLRHLVPHQKSNAPAWQPVLAIFSFCKYHSFLISSGQLPCIPRDPARGPVTNWFGSSEGLDKKIYDEHGYNDDMTGSLKFFGNWGSLGVTEFSTNCYTINPAIL